MARDVWPRDGGHMNSLCDPRQHRHTTLHNEHLAREFRAHKRKQTIHFSHRLENNNHPLRTSTRYGTSILSPFIIRHNVHCHNVCRSPWIRQIRQLKTVRPLLMLRHSAQCKQSVCICLLITKIKCIKKFSLYNRYVPSYVL